MSCELPALSPLAFEILGRATRCGGSVCSGAGLVLCLLLHDHLLHHINLTGVCSDDPGASAKGGSGSYARALAGLLRVFVAKATHQRPV